MRALLWILAIPIVLVLAAVLLIPLFLDTQTLVSIAAKQIEEQSGIELRVDGDASLSLFPKVALAMSEVRAELPDGGGRIEADTLATGVALVPLFRGAVEVDSLLLEGVTFMSVARDEAVARAESLDTSTLSDAELDEFYSLRRQSRESAAVEASASIVVVAMSLEVGELVLRDIRVLSVDEEDEVLSEIRLEELLATGLNIDGRSVPLSARVSLPDDETPMEIVLDTTFSADVNSNIVTIDSFSARVTGATQEPLEIDASGRITLTTQVADLDLALRSEGLSGSGSVRYASFESPQIDAELSLSELTPALLVLAGPEAAESEAAATGTASDLPLHALRMIDTRARLKIDAAAIDKHVLEDVDATLRIVDGVATLEPVRATLHGGAIAFSAELNGRYNTARLSTEGNVADFDLAGATAALDAGVAASGTADLAWDIAGSGATTEQLLGSLTGPISFDTRAITIRDIALEGTVCRAVALVNQESLSAAFPADTAFEELHAEVRLVDGVARLDPLTARLTAFGLSGTGVLDIASGDLRASLRAQLSEELAELDPACRINERYTQLRWPVECEGNLAGDPADWCGVNTTEIIKDLAEGELKRKASEEAGKLLNKIFDRG
jgi:AsmA protein